MRFTPVTLALWLVAAVLAAPALVHAQAADPWTDLWQGRHAQARTALTTAAAKDAKDPRAALGLALLATVEDDPVAALGAWRRYYQLAPGSWQAQAYWPAVVELAAHTGRWSVLDAMAADLAASPAAPPALKAAAQLVQADAAERAGKPKAAEAIWSAMGYVRDWRVMGPFPNASHSGFANVFPPETELDFTRSYTGMDNRDLKWHALKLVTRNGQCGIGTALGDEDESAFFAATAIAVPTAQPALLAFDPDGASKIYLNGRLVHADETYRESQALCPAPFAIPVTLQAGWNTLVVKMLSDEECTAAFRLRVTAPSGGGLAGLQVDPAKATMVAAEAGTPGKAEPALATLLRALPPSSETALGLGMVLYRLHDFEGAIAVLRGALEQDADNTWLRWALSGALREDDQVDEARAALKQVRTTNTRIAKAELTALAEEEDELDSDVYQERLEALQQAFPNSARVKWALFEAYMDQDMEAEALQAARAATAIAQGPEEMDRLAMIYDYNDMPGECDKALQAGLKVTPHAVDLLQTRMIRLEEQGKTDAAIAAYQQLLAISPEPHLYFGLATLYQKSKKDPAKAARVLEELRQLCPQDAQACTELADVLREMGRKDDAMSLYRTAIALDPTRVELRDKVRVLAGQKPILDLAPPSTVDEVIQQARTLKPQHEEPARILLSEARHLVYPDYATVFHHHLVVKIFDKAGVELFSQVGMLNTSWDSHDTLEKARIIKPDGKVQDCGKGFRGITFPSLEAGDIIDVTYRVEDCNTGGLARQFWASWDFDEISTPCARSRYTLITPTALTFQVTRHGDVPEPKVREEGEWRIHEWAMTDVPALRDEVLSPGPFDIGAWVDISSIPNWQTIVAWYRDLAGPRCVPDDAVRAKAAALTTDATTEQEKIRALATFVARDITYQSRPFRMSAYVPTKGKQVLREGYGDCKDKAALLCALLAAVNLKADMVLVSPRDEGITPLLPSPRFSHAINRVHTADGDLWIDTTADQMTYGELPPPVQGVPALIINAETTALVTTPTLSADNCPLATALTGVIGNDGRLSGTLQVTMAGQVNWMIRSALKRVPENQHEMLLRVLLPKMLPNSTYESGTLGNLANPDTPLVLKMKFHMDNYSSTAGDFLLLRLPWQVHDFNELVPLISDPKRTLDLECSDFYGMRKASVVLTLPDGFAPEGLQPVVESTTPWGVSRMTYRMEGNTLHAEMQVTQTALRVKAADLPKYSDFLKGALKESGKQLVFKKR